MSYDKKQGVMNDSQPYQQISNNTVASTTLDICSHDIFSHKKKGAEEEVLDGVFHYRAIHFLATGERCDFEKASYLLVCSSLLKQNVVKMQAVFDCISL